MSDYRVYRFDGGSRIEMAEWIEASDDDAAINEARRLGERASRCELWHRLVVSLHPQELVK